MTSEFDSEVLSHFGPSVARHFAPLVTEFGFVTVEERIHRPDVWVKLRNKTTQVTVNYEWGVGCWVTIGRLTRWLKRIPMEYSLQDIAEAADPTTAFPDLRCREYDRKCVEAALRKLATITLSHAAELLRGDFAVTDRIAAVR